MSELERLEKEVREILVESQKATRGFSTGEESSYRDGQESAYDEVLDMIERIKTEQRVTWTEEDTRKKA